MTRVHQDLTFDTPHRRFNPLTGEWVLVSAHRTSRPWQGQVEEPTPDIRPPYDPDCYLCPGNSRVGGAMNDAYEGTFVFTNDFPALVPDGEGSAPVEADLFRAQPVAGTCRVVCFSPRHDLTLAQMDESAIRSVVDTWAEQTEELGRTHSWVQVFENRGAAMGASNPHPHGQIWASSSIPTLITREAHHQQQHFEATGEVLLSAYAAEESRRGARVVVENDEWIVVVPYWAVWPFETLVLPRRHVVRMEDLDDRQRNGLSSIMKMLLARYDNLFATPFPYSMGWHGAPYDDDADGAWLLHAHLYPPLLRSATIRKFMVGYELMAESQRDLTAEDAAARLRAQPTTHYLDTLTDASA